MRMNYTDSDGRQAEQQPEFGQSEDLRDGARDTGRRTVAEGELFLELSRQLEADTKRKLWDVLEGLESIELETQAYRDEVLVEARQQALDFIKVETAAYRDEIIADAEQQARDHLQQSSFEAERMLAEAELARNEARAELETQMILTDAAKLREESHEVLGEIKRRLEEPRDSRSR